MREVSLYRELWFFWSIHSLSVGVLFCFRWLIHSLSVGFLFPLSVALFSFCWIHVSSFGRFILFLLGSYFLFQSICSLSVGFLFLLSVDSWCPSYQGKLSGLLANLACPSFIKNCNASGISLSRALILSLRNLVWFCSSFSRFSFCLELLIHSLIGI